MQGLRVFLLAAIAAGFFAGAAAAETWRAYFNPRFGVSADVPAGWSIGPRPANDDGRRFTSPDGSAFLTVSGIFAALSPEAESALRESARAGETITYKATRANVVVVSGTRGDRIFYRKSILDCGIWNDLSIEYPAREKARYDALVAHVAASLKPGRGYQTFACG